MTSVCIYSPDFGGNFALCITYCVLCPKQHICSHILGAVAYCVLRIAYCVLHSKYVVSFWGELCIAYCVLRIAYCAASFWEQVCIVYCI